jgi:polyhydroxyalkanoate synthesis regulator phasin
MSFDTAKKCFGENVQLFGNAQTQPEKFNHYNGLYNMAEALQALQSEVHRLRQEVDDLRRRQP